MDRLSIWAAVLALVTVASSLLTLFYPPFEPFELAISALVLIAFVRYGVLAALQHSYPAEAMTGLTMWRVAVVSVMSVLGLPVILVLLATNGQVRGAVLAAYGSNASAHHYWAVGGRQAAGTVAELCLWGILGLVVVVPGYLRTRRHATAASSPVSAWLANFASLATAAYIFLERFGATGKAGLARCSTPGGGGRRGAPSTGR